MPGEVLQAGEVAPEVRLGVQVDVERADVEERQRQVLGRRVVHVGQQRLGRRRLHVVVELANEALDAGLAVPADDGGGNLVAEGEDEGGGVAGQLAHPRDDVLADAAAEVGVVEERDVLRPGQADHHAQPVARGLVEHPGSGHGVGADGVEARFPHPREVRRDDVGRGELVARGVGCEGAVRDALDEKPITPERQELAVDGGSRLGGRGSHWRNTGVAPFPARRSDRGLPSTTARVSETAVVIGKTRAWRRSPRARATGTRRRRRLASWGTASSLRTTRGRRVPDDRGAPAPHAASRASSTRPRGSSDTRSRAAPGRCRSATGRSSTARAAA